MVFMEIYIKEKSGGREIRIPWLPNTIEFATNGTRFESYEIIDLGEVRKQNGRNMANYRWESIFPGAARSNLPFLKGKWINPSKYQSLLSSWRVKGTKLNLLITGTPINHDVLLEDYTCNYEGGFGDCRYTISFIDNRELTVTSTQVKVNKPKTPTRPAQTQKTHTVKNDDTLWGIAVKYLKSGTKADQIYSLNKSIIESTARKYGFKSSNNGWWIFPGTVLKIPS